MSPNTKFKPSPSTTLDRARTSLAQLGPRAAPFSKLLAAVTSALDLLEGPQATEAQLKACVRLIERAEQPLSPWHKPRPSRAKPASRLTKVLDEVLLIPRFAAKPMSAATVREIQSRIPKSRAAIIIAIQRRRVRQMGRAADV
jgi:hypothetical protein